jgi:hypothetical protein
MEFLLKRRDGRDIAKNNGTVPFKTGRMVSLGVSRYPSRCAQETRTCNVYVMMLLLYNTDGRPVN